MAANTAVKVSLMPFWHSFISFLICHFVLRSWWANKNSKFKLRIKENQNSSSQSFMRNPLTLKPPVAYVFAQLWINYFLQTKSNKWWNRSIPCNKKREAECLVSWVNWFCLFGQSYEAKSVGQFSVLLTIIFLVISFGQALPHNQQAVFIALGVDMTHCTAHGNRASNNNNSELSLTQKKRQCDMRWCFALYFNGSFSLLFLQTPEISEQSCPWTCVPCLLFTDPCHCF